MTALLLGNSFGYFGDAGNISFLRSLHAMIAPGGALMFDTTSVERARLMAHENPHTVHWVVTKSFGTVRDERWRTWDEKTHTMRSRKLHAKEGTGEVLLDVAYTIKIYPLGELANMLRYVGFHHVAHRTSSAQFYGLMKDRNCIAALR